MRMEQGRSNACLFFATKKIVDRKANRDEAISTTAVHPQGEMTNPQNIQSVVYGKELLVDFDRGVPVERQPTLEG